MKIEKIWIFDFQISSEMREDHALFISYAPFDKPEIVVTVIIEHGGSGSTAAAPIARNIIDFYFNNNMKVSSND